MYRHRTSPRSPPIANSGHDPGIGTRSLRIAPAIPLDATPIVGRVRVRTIRIRSGESDRRWRSGGHRERSCGPWRSHPIAPPNGGGPDWGPCRARGSNATTPHPPRTTHTDPAAGPPRRSTPRHRPRRPSTGLPRARPPRTSSTADPDPSTAAACAGCGWTRWVHAGRRVRRPGHDPLAHPPDLVGPGAGDRPLGGRRLRRGNGDLVHAAPHAPRCPFPRPRPGLDTAPRPPGGLADPARRGRRPRPGDAGDRGEMAAGPRPPRRDGAARVPRLPACRPDGGGRRRGADRDRPDDPARRPRARPRSAAVHAPAAADRDRRRGRRAQHRHRRGREQRRPGRHPRARRPGVQRGQRPDLPRGPTAPAAHPLGLPELADAVGHARQGGPPLRRGRTGRRRPVRRLRPAGGGSDPCLRRAGVRARRSSRAPTSPSPSSTGRARSPAR